MEVKQLKKKLDFDKKKSEVVEVLLKKSNVEIKRLKNESLDIKVIVAEVKKNHQIHTVELQDWCKDKFKKVL